MISPLSSNSSSIPTTEAANPKPVPASTQQSPAPSGGQDTVELSAQAKASLSGTASGSNQSASGYSSPATVQAHSNRGKAAS